MIHIYIFLNRIEIAVSNYVHVQHNKVVPATILVECADELVVYFTSGQTGSIGSSLVLPTDSLGTHYIVMTYNPGPLDETFITIAAVNTGITNVDVVTKGSPGVRLTYGGNTYNHLDIIRIGLNQYESIILTSSYDLTGTDVTSDKPVSVYSGNLYLSLNNDNYEDLAFEQMQPVGELGETFIVVANPRVDAFNVKIVATSSTTDLYVGETPHSLTNIGDFITVDLSSNSDASYVAINSTSPIMVATFSASSVNLDGVRSDVTMTLITPIERYSRNYVFINAASSYHLTPTYVQHVSLLAHVNETSLVTIDGITNWPSLNWTGIQDFNKGTNIIFLWYTCTLDSTAGAW